MKLLLPLVKISKLSKQNAGDRLPTDGTDGHGNAKNDKLLRAGREISKLSKLKTESKIGREDNADNIAPKSYA